MRSSILPLWCAALTAILVVAPFGEAGAAPLKAGAAKVDISHPDAGPPSPTLYVKAVAISDGKTTAVLATVDAVAIGQIGHIRNEYLGNVRAQLKRQLGIEPANFLINASHCHGVVCADIEQRTVEAVKLAIERMVPVKVGVGIGSEDRIMENRRMKLKNGRDADVRHAYSVASDDAVASVGPVDPQIGVLRLDRMDGKPLAVVYNFACHPIQGVPSGANTSDITGFSSQVLEDVLGDDSVALFVQGCGGDINPIMYKDVARPRDAEPLGNMLALSTLKAYRKIVTKEEAPLKLINEPLELPRADLAERIEAQEAEQMRLLKSLKGTSLNFKTFLPLVVKYKVSGEFPSYYSHTYLHDRMLGRNDLDKLDASNRANIDQYIENILVMEELTRVQTNLALLKLHHGQNVAAGKRTLDVEVGGLRVGDFVLVTFPGELTVRIGLNIKEHSPHKPTFVAGYTNGYIYYAPTAEQLLNVGNAQEDSDCLLAPEWQAIFEEKAGDVLKRL
ncbi:MAG: hypothetical protein NT069_27195 [Planctomycetota bacterium]|nr:hypothetical protein [Planctomycetota bacterium]